VPPEIVLRDVDTLEEARLVEAMQGEVWGMDDRDITPLTHLVAVRKAGGQLIGAFDGETLVGFIYGFVGLEHGQTIHHSHLLAVKPAYRNQDIGYRLKLAQRAAVLAQGIRRITWTFDPLQSANAHLNFRKLGATSNSYRVDFYGAETSSFLHRIGTDRLWLTWELDSPRVLRRLRDEAPAEAPPETIPSLVRIAADGSPEELDLRDGLAAEQTAIEIPGDINACGREQPQRAVRWRELTRRAFGEAFANGFVVDDFHRAARGAHCVGVYVLSRSQRVRGSW
jgi:predicted GNAT superfamily acetyltransferase